MGKIGFIAPDSQTARIVEGIAGRFSLPVSTKVGSGDQRIELCMEAAREGADVIVGRWGLFQSEIAAAVDVPLVNVKVTGYDIARALLKAAELDESIGVLARRDVAQGASTLAPMLGISLKKVIQLTSYALSELEDGLITMKEAGVKVLLGGTRVTRLSSEYGLHGVFIIAGEEALVSALVEANRIIPIQKREREKTEQICAILDSVHDGVIAIDSKGHITVFNHMAEKITGLKSEAVSGRPVSVVLPDIGLGETLDTGQSEIGMIEKLGSGYVVMSRLPVHLGDQVVGAVATFVEASQVQSMEENVRKRLSDRGLLAKFTFNDILGSSPKLCSTVQVARKYAEVDAPIVVCGETGVGKELFVQAIHNASSRWKGPFVAINCGALPESVLESELFGYVGGAFTGARKEGKTGLFELGHRGTVFLDEVSEMPISIQTRFLRVLQEREVVRLGDEKVIPVDIRVIAATNRDLEQLVKEGTFRRDLYYRINVLNLKIPPLRERGEDVLILLDYFLKKYAKVFGKAKPNVSEEFKEWALSYTWPGNVRELENVAQRMVACSDMQQEELIDVVQPSICIQPPLDTRDSAIPEVRTIEDAEWNAITRALIETKGNKTKAAKILGISTTTLWRKLKARKCENLKIDPLRHPDECYFS